MVERSQERSTQQRLLSLDSVVSIHIRTVIWALIICESFEQPKIRFQGRDFLTTFIPHTWLMHNGRLLMLVATIESRDNGSKRIEKLESSL